VRAPSSCHVRRVSYLLLPSTSASHQRGKEKGKLAHTTIWIDSSLLLLLLIIIPITSRAIHKNVRLNEEKKKICHHHTNMHRGRHRHTMLDADTQAQAHTTLDGRTRSERCRLETNNKALSMYEIIKLYKCLNHARTN
jgi:hypothetical protein